MIVQLDLPAECRSEIDPEFLQQMVNAMCVSFHKYGRVTDAFPGKIDALASARQKLREYHRTGNREELIDAANYIMIEAIAPAHSNHHYAPTDSDASTGRVQHDGAVTAKENSRL